MQLGLLVLDGVLLLGSGLGKGGLLVHLLLVIAIYRAAATRQLRTALLSGDMNRAPN